MNIAVTGATGFLGRYIVRQLAADGHACRCWHRPESDRGGFEDAAGAIEWIEGALGDHDAADRLVRGSDAVVHAGLARPAAASFRAAGQADFLDYVQTNLLGSLALIDAARRANVPRLVFIASCAVHEIVLDDRPLDEAHPLWPASHYGAYKAAVEKYVHSFGLGQRWEICSLRPTGIYGPARPVEHSRWYDLVARVVRGEPVESARGGKEVHAADVARAVGVLLRAEGIAGQAYNCYDMYISDEQVARIAKELTGSTSTVSDLNRGPKHQIETDKIRALGMRFGGEPLLRETVAALVDHAKRASG